VATGTGWKVILENKILIIKLQ